MKAVAASACADSFPCSEAHVWAVIVTWNERDSLLECLDSLKCLDYPQDQIRIAVIDNASTDESAEAVRSRYPDILLLENEKNVGYVAAANQGIERALREGASYIWVMNNDVVVSSDSLTELVRAAEASPDIGIVGPIVCSASEPARVENAGYEIDFWTGRLTRLRYGIDVFRNRDETIAEVDSNLGCSNLIKAKVFSTIGGFDPLYEIYFEETDFNVRARRQGFRVVLAKRAKVVHRSAWTMNQQLFRRAYLLLRNLFLFQLLNARRRHLLTFIPAYFLVHLPYFLLYGSAYGIRVKMKQLGLSLVRGRDD